MVFTRDVEGFLNRVVEEARLPVEGDFALGLALVGGYGEDFVVESGGGRIR